MDRMKWKSAAAAALKKYYLVALAVAAGLLLLCLPQQEEIQAAEVPAETQALQEELEEILSRLAGAGKVKVLLTQAAGEETYYQVDEAISEDSQRRDTVVYTGQNREEAGLVRRVDPPEYRGAVILCQGADQAAVRLAITQAVVAATGLSSERVTVLKMK